MKREKILLIQLFSYGDCLYATTVARQIKSDYPECHLIWMISEYCNSIIDNNPYVDEKHIIFDINYANAREKWKDFERYLKVFQKEQNIARTYFTQLINRNLANYDYCIRSSIFRGYDRKIDVPIQSVLNLSINEKIVVEKFVAKHNLDSFNKIILLEYAPRSGQVKFSMNDALQLAKQITKDLSTAVILTSTAIPDEEQNIQIIDGSVLSLREIAHLTHYADLLIGCSSGITWVSQSSAARIIPMIQILDPDAWWLNSVAYDHQRFQLPNSHIIEMANPNPIRILNCIKSTLSLGFEETRKQYHEQMPQKFKMTRGILTYLISIGNFKGVVRHIRINLAIFGWQAYLIKAIIKGIVLSPIMLLKKKIIKD